MFFAQLSQPINWWARSVWNGRWTLVITAFSLLNDEQVGLDNCIKGVSDGTLFRRTYPNGGNEGRLWSAVGERRQKKRVAFAGKTAAPFHWGLLRRFRFSRPWGGGEDLWTLSSLDHRPSAADHGGDPPPPERGLNQKTRVLPAFYR
jgi:hypothetical protein